MNKEIMHLIHLRDQFKSCAKSNILARSMYMYKNLRNQVVKKIANATAAYMRNKIMENMNNPKKLWKILQQVAPTKPRPTNFSFIEVNGQQISNPVGISNAFNEYFINIQHTNISVPDCIDSNEQDAHLVNFIKSHISEATVFHIPPISTQHFIEDLKSNPNNKATGLDGIGIKPLKLALNVIAPSLTHIYNSSIARGTFTINFKQGKLISVCKRDSVHNRNNYPLISILPIISKPLERHVAKAYLGYLTSNNSHHSRETALLNLTDNWLKVMDSRKLVGSVLLDLSKAFDLVDHDLLLSKISKYHVTNTSQEWFKLVIEHNAAALMAQCLMHWCWPEEFRKGQFWAQYYSRCTSTTFQLESLTQMSTYMQMTLKYGRLTVTHCLFSLVFKTVLTELVDGYL